MERQYIGIDLHQASVHACAVREHGTRIWEAAFARTAEGLAAFAQAGFAAKTDRLDARRLADALRRGSVVSIYVPPPAMRERRELTRGRQHLNGDAHETKAI